MDERTPHELLLALAGRVDDDLLAWCRELVAVGEEGYALELLTATLAADRAPLPAPVRTALVDTARAVRSDLDADALLAPAAPDGSGPEHRFDPAHPLVDRLAAAVAGLPARQVGGCRLHVTARTTPAGAAPGPLPHPVVVAETTADDPRPLDVLAYRLAIACARAGTAAAVEVVVDGAAVPEYQRTALRGARPVAAREPADEVTTAPAPAGSGEPDPPGPLSPGRPVPDLGTPDLGTPEPVSPEPVSPEPAASGSSSAGRAADPASGTASGPLAASTAGVGGSVTDRTTPGRRASVRHAFEEPSGERAVEGERAPDPVAPPREHAHPWPAEDPPLPPSEPEPPARRRPATSGLAHRMASWEAIDDPVIEEPRPDPWALLADLPAFRDAGADAPEPGRPEDGGRRHDSDPAGPAGDARPADGARPDGAGPGTAAAPPAGNGVADGPPPPRPDGAGPAAADRPATAPAVDEGRHDASGGEDPAPGTADGEATDPAVPRVLPQPAPAEPVVAARGRHDTAEDARRPSALRPLPRPAPGGRRHRRLSPVDDPSPEAEVRPLRAAPPSDTPALAALVERPDPGAGIDEHDPLGLGVLPLGPEEPRPPAPDAWLSDWITGDWAMPTADEDTATTGAAAPEPGGPGPETPARLTDADRELLSRLQSELREVTRPRIVRRAGIGGTPQGRGPRPAPPDMAG